MGFKDTTKCICTTWKKHNVFDFSVGDSIAYVCLYLVLPVLITTCSLFAFPENTTSAAYCYVSVLISAINAIYDNALRWTPQDNPTFKNVKLLCILFPNALIALYCLFEILVILVIQSIHLRCDGILLIYVIVVLVAGNDFFECLKRRAVGISCIDELLEV